MFLLIKIKRDNKRNQLSDNLGKWVYVANFCKHQFGALFHRYNTELNTHGAFFHLTAWTSNEFLKLLFISELNWYHLMLKVDK